eukprot:Sspe_Gene.98588::Locus_71984_Transcript_1_1_Confidence_1.000_Length_473::g.98588::m.98588
MDTSKDAALARSIPSARPPDYQGVMRKRGAGLLKGWQDRTFKLYGHMLVYYQNDLWKGEIDLREASATPTGDGGKFIIEGPHAKRGFELDAGSAEKMEKWFARLHNAGVQTPNSEAVAAVVPPWNCDRCTLQNQGI